MQDAEERSKEEKKFWWTIEGDCLIMDILVFLCYERMLSQQQQQQHFDNQPGNESCMTMMPSQKQRHHHHNSNNNNFTIQNHPMNHDKIIMSSTP